MYRHTLKFITKVDPDKMPLNLRIIWDTMPDESRLALVKAANSSMIKEFIDTTNVNHTWATLEVMELKESV